MISKDDKSVKRSQIEKEELRERLNEKLRKKKLKEALEASNRAAREALRYKPKDMVVIEEYGRAFMATKEEAREYYANICKGCKMLSEEKEVLARENEELRKKLGLGFWKKLMISIGLKKDE